MKDEITIQQIALHRVGNPSRGEGLRTSKSPLQLDDHILDLLKHYFLSPFKTESRFRLFHESDLGLNEVYSYANQIFTNPEKFFEAGIGLAKHLHAQSEHPKIKQGEFYLVLFDNGIIEGQRTEVLGLFKSESRDTYLKVFPAGDNYAIDSEQGININKLDKGCLIYNLEESEGYVVEVVDNLNSADARYWVDDFLHVTERRDAYYQTEKTLAMTKKFVTSYLPEKFEMDRADEAGMLNNSSKYFKEHDTFDLETFANQVLDHPDLVDTFKSYKNAFEEEYKIQIDNHFDISDRAAKKQERNFKSVLKLDKNFSLYIHGDRRYIEKGYDDEKQLSYYKLYFSQER
jgi:hypothetical protein